MWSGVCSCACACGWVCTKTARRGSRRNGPFYLFTQLSSGVFERVLLLLASLHWSVPIAASPRSNPLPGSWPWSWLSQESGRRLGHWRMSLPCATPSSWMVLLRLQRWMGLRCLVWSPPLPKQGPRCLWWTWLGNHSCGQVFRTIAVSLAPLLFMNICRSGQRGELPGMDSLPVGIICLILLVVP